MDFANVNWANVALMVTIYMGFFIGGYISGWRARHKTKNPASLRQRGYV